MPMPLKGRTLIASDAPLVAALIGLLVESSGGQPLFPLDREPLAEAIARLRPVSLALVGVGLSEIHSDLFFALAERYGIRVVVFGPEQQLGEIADVAAHRGVAWFSLPPTQRAIDVAFHLTQDRRAPVSEDRRQDAHASVGHDGTPLLVDQLGTQWLVYDRRASGGRRRTDSGVDRMFVSEQGERFSCHVDPTVAGDTSASTLVHQLERAQADSAGDG
jgi:hypothetical protein